MIQPLRAPMPGTSHPAPPIAKPAEIHRSVVVCCSLRAAPHFTAAGRQAIKAAAAELKKAQRIVIHGRTDAIGSRHRNDGVAQRRAEAALHAVKQLGLSPSADITLDAHGSCCYAADNVINTGRAANRRVEVEFFVVNP